MRRIVLKGIFQTLVLMLALFLISVSVVQLMELAQAIVSIEEVSEEGKELISTANQELAASKSTNSVIAYILKDKPMITGLLYMGMFLLLALLQFTELFPRESHAGKAGIWKMINAAGYLACGIPFAICGNDYTAIVIMNFIYTAILIGESVARLREKPGKSRSAVRIVIIILALANLIFLWPMPFFVLGVVILRSVKEILAISFSQIRLDVLRKIIRKTYASEVLLGMILLMVACSLLLSIIEPGMPDFFDALWYCFAIVTTIGFGDVSAVTLTGRILSVILGAYGIIVVALITSIIVNFYNEVKKENEEESA